MDDLLREFLTETNESLDTVDMELVRFEREPNNADILGKVFRLVHTIKGTCGFLGLPRLEALAHAAETVMGRFRDGLQPTAEAVTAILQSIDRIKEILAELEDRQQEPEGSDQDLIDALDRVMASADAGEAPAPRQTVGSLAHQVVERPLQPGEASLDELERAFRETAIDPSAPPAPAVPRRRRGECDEEERSEARVSSQTLRVNVDTLEHLMTMVSELVLTRNQLLQLVRGHDGSEFKAPLQRLSSVTAELQEGVMKTRMQPIGHAWQKLPRVVRDLARELGKEIELQMLGADTELDRQVLELIKDPLTHMVRNSADHGLETPAERRALGKPEKGTIRLNASHKGGHIIIEVADDGRGLNTGRIKHKAIASGLVTEAEAEKMSEPQLHKFIFAPGLSTAATVTSVSGRGVGMDVVKNNIDQIGGTLDVKSVQGAGTCLTIKIPLTLAIISALIIECDGDRFALPQLAVVELVRARAGSDHQIERVKGTAVLRLRNRLLPLVHLGSLLGTSPAGTEIGASGFVVVTQVGSQTFGIVVDGVVHTEEIVLKPMSSKLRDIGMFSGNTILGDGSVILIIDPNGIAEALGSTAASAQDDATTAAPAAEQTTSLLVFRAGSPELRAVPLSLVTRLEEFAAATIERSNGRDFVQYRGQLMPLLRVDDNVALKRAGSQPVLVFCEAGRSVGLAVDEIVDIVEEPLAIEVASAERRVIGSAIVNGKATEIIDVGHYLPLAFDDWQQRAQPGMHAGILLVDDSPFFRNLLRPVLATAGFRVTAVASAEAALALAETQAFAAIVSDVDMPGMGGIALAQALRARERTAAVPLIAIASHAAPQLLRQLHAAGFSDFVPKFDRLGLIAALRGSRPTAAEAA